MDLDWPAIDDDACGHQQLAEQRAGGLDHASSKRKSIVDGIAHNSSASSASVEGVWADVLAEHQRLLETAETYEQVKKLTMETVQKFMRRTGRDVTLRDCELAYARIQLRFAEAWRARSVALAEHRQVLETTEIHAEAFVSTLTKVQAEMKAKGSDVTLHECAESYERDLHRIISSA